MLNITLISYDESADNFEAAVIDSVAHAPYNMQIPASLLPYIAPDEVSACEDFLPHGLIGTCFSLKSPLVD